ncbi:MAG: ferritin-like domain-containing protein [Bacteroidales bacterium]
MSDYHEPAEELSAISRDMTRALNSLKEEIEAIDWYQQRVATCSDAQLKKILEHNRDEEIEHACMALEWLRRNMNGWDDHLQQYLFTTRDITKIES